ncbi:hypothetical protein BJ508DRAFT_118123 [Ascobolus immersus RN42]|uniref:DUF7580 domain-containing protein n=1 Tax=Ascobolus immersus RN42 TaxID=1160509 RepID=A0A3N4I6E1_ASCIM|nr:hypothetical protein BJ508DRAFT_118123 [Ascobolus immersus RN42]
MSGFEIAGVILGVLPFVAANVKTEIDTSRNARSIKKTDNSLKNFYDEFRWEAYYLKMTLEVIFLGLPNVPPEIKEDILSGKIVDWYEDQNVVGALESILGSAMNSDEFKRVTRKVFELFVKLIGEKTSMLSADSMNHGKLCTTIEGFRTVRNDWHFLKRRKFFQKLENRKAWLADLTKWNQRLRSLVDRCCLETQSSAREKRSQAYAVLTSKAETKTATAANSTSLTRFRKLSRRLFTALSGCWQDCECPQRHQANFCLQNFKTTSSHTPGSEMNFDFLICDWAAESTPGDYQVKWHEGSVSISTTNRRSTDEAPGDALQDICIAVEKVRNQSMGLRLHIEDRETSQTVLLLDLFTFNLPYHNYTPATISFGEALSLTKPSISSRLKLASLLASSVLQLHESPWQSSQWSKQHITFFYKSHGEIDYDRPHLNTCFEAFPTELREKKNPDLVHRHPGILRLGILLMEVYLWNNIEAYRDARDLKNGQPTAMTDFYTANRKLLELKELACFEFGNTYFDLITSCLDISWIGPNPVITLDDETMCESFERIIILPLQAAVQDIEEVEKSQVQSAGSEDVDGSGKRKKLKRLFKRVIK